MPDTPQESPLPAGARSGCPIANALDLLGDKWTLLVVRDLLLGGRRRFGELLAAPEKIPTNLLTDRLRRLEENGIVVKVPYDSRPRRHEYHPTPKGEDLIPILLAMAEWSSRHVPGTFEPTPQMVERARAALAARAGREGAAGRE